MQHFSSPHTHLVQIHYLYKAVKIERERIERTCSCFFSALLVLIWTIIIHLQCPQSLVPAHVVTDCKMEVESGKRPSSTRREGISWHGTMVYSRYIMPTKEDLHPYHIYYYDHISYGDTTLILKHCVRIKRMNKNLPSTAGMHSILGRSDSDFFPHPPHYSQFPLH